MVNGRRISLDLVDWPDHECLLWDQAGADGGLFKEAGAAAEWSPTTQRQVQKDYGLWMFFLGDHFVGRGGLRNTKVEDVDEVEVYYALLPEYWGKGFATEMATDLTRVAFDSQRLERLVGFTLETNVGSQRVLEKAGFSFERVIMHAGMPHFLYIRSRDTQE